MNAYKCKRRGTDDIVKRCWIVCPPRWSNQYCAIQRVEGAYYDIRRIHYDKTFTGTFESWKKPLIKF